MPKLHKKEHIKITVRNDIDKPVKAIRSRSLPVQTTPSRNKSKNNIYPKLYVIRHENGDITVSTRKPEIPPPESSDSDDHSATDEK